MLSASHATACVSCGKKFGFFFWRHTCQHCQRAVCEPCKSSSRATTPRGLLSKRKCQLCLREGEAGAGGPAAAPPAPSSSAPSLLFRTPHDDDLALLVQCALPSQAPACTLLLTAGAMGDASLQAALRLALDAGLSIEVLLEGEGAAPLRAVERSPEPSGTTLLLEEPTGTSAALLQAERRAFELSCKAREVCITEAELDALLARHHPIVRGAGGACNMAATLAPLGAGATAAAAQPPRTIRAAVRVSGGAHVLLVAHPLAWRAAEALAAELQLGARKLVVELLPAVCTAQEAKARAACATHALLVLSDGCLASDGACAGVLQEWAERGRELPHLHMLVDDAWHAGVEDFGDYMAAVKGLALPEGGRSLGPFDVCVARPLQRQGSHGARERMVEELLEDCGCVKVGEDGALAPPLLPAHFSEAAIAGALGELMQCLLGQASAVAVVGGEGGLGKSVVVAAAARTDAVKEAFQDVLWVPIGRTAGEGQLAAALRALVRELGVTLKAEEQALPLPALAARLASILSERKVLCVFDDAALGMGHMPVLAAVAPLTGGSRVVITTRELAGAAAAVRAADMLCKEVPLQPLPMPLAVELLQKAAGIADLCVEQQVLEALCTAAKQLPLALQLAGGVLRIAMEQPNLSGESDAVYAGKVAADMAVKMAAHATSPTTAALELALEQMAPNDADKYLAFGHFEEDVELPLALLVRAWGMEGGVRGEERAKALLEDWADGALIRWSSKGCVALHDLALQFAAQRGQQECGGSQQWLERRRLLVERLQGQAVVGVGGLLLPKELAMLKAGSAGVETAAAQLTARGKGPWHVFLSHYQLNGGGMAMRVRNALVDAGVRVWYDMDQEPTADGMEAGVKGSELFVLLLTPGVLSRPAVQREVAAAVQHDKHIFLLEGSAGACEKTAIVQQLVEFFLPTNDALAKSLAESFKRKKSWLAFTALSQSALSTQSTADDSALSKSEFAELVKQLSPKLVALLTPKTGTFAEHLTALFVTLFATAGGLAERLAMLLPREEGAEHLMALLSPKKLELAIQLSAVFTPERLAAAIPVHAEGGLFEGRTVRPLVELAVTSTLAMEFPRAPRFTVAVKKRAGLQLLLVCSSQWMEHGRALAGAIERELKGVQKVWLLSGDSEDRGGQQSIEASHVLVLLDKHALGEPAFVGAFKAAMAGASERVRVLFEGDGRWGGAWKAENLYRGGEFAQQLQAREPLQVFERRLGEREVQVAEVVAWLGGAEVVGGSGALQVPPLPPFFSEDAAKGSVEALKGWLLSTEAEPQSELISRLFGGGGGQVGSEAKTCGVLTGGAGGLGKSVAAIAVARQSEVQLAFDATLWVTVGRGSPMAVLVHGLQAALLELGGGGNDSRASDPSAALVDALREALETTCTLLIVDDVAVGEESKWTRGEQFRLLRRLVPRTGRSKVLVTSRDIVEWEALAAAAVEEAGWGRVAVQRLHPLQVQDAVGLLKKTARLNTEADKEGLVELAIATGQSPFALQIAACALRAQVEKPPGTAATGAARMLLGMLQPGHCVDVEDAVQDLASKDGMQQYEAVYRVIGASLQALPRAAMRRLGVFALFEEDADTPAQVLGLAWRLKDAPQHHRALAYLKEAALIKNGTAGCLSLHDLAWDFAGALGGGQLKAITNALDRWGEEEGRLLGKLYLHLLREGGRGQQATDSVWQLQWLIEGVRRRGVAAVTKEVAEQLKWVQEQVGEGQETELKLLHQMLVMAAQAFEGEDGPGNVAPHLIGRLGGLEGARIERLIKEARAWDGGGRTWLRPVRPNFPQPGGACEGVLEGHTDGIVSVCVLEDGRIVSGSSDSTLRVWDAATGVCMQVLEGHTRSVRCVCVLGDGRIVSGSEDGTLRVWDAATGVCFQVLKGHKHNVTSICALRNGHIVSGSLDSTLRVWDAVTGACIRVLNGHKEGVSSVCELSMTNGRVLSASFDGTLRVWNVATGVCLGVLTEHANKVVSVCALQDRGIVTGSLDATLRVYDLATEVCVRVLQGHTSGVTSIISLRNGRIVSGSEDKTFRMWVVATGLCVRVLEGHIGGVFCAGALGDGRFVSGSGDKTLRIWDATTGLCMRVLEGHTNFVSSVSSLGDKLIVSSSGDNTLRVWDATSGVCMQVLKGHILAVTCLCALGDKRIVSGSDDKVLKVWDAVTGECICDLQGHLSVIFCVCALGGDGRLVSGSGDYTLRVWDTAIEVCEHVLEGHTRAVTSVCALEGGQLVSGSWDMTLRVWDISTGVCVRIIRGHSVKCLCALGDGRIVSGSDDGSIRVWDPNKGVCLRVFQAPSAVSSISALGIGRIVCGSDDKTLRVWDAATGVCVQVLTGHTHAVTSVHATRNGCIVSGSADNTLRVWDAAMGLLSRSLDRDADCLSSLCAMQEGSIVSGSGDNKVRVWDAATGVCLQVLERHTGGVNCVCTLETGLIVSGSMDHTLIVWDAATGVCERVLEGHKKSVNSVCALGSGHIVSGSADNTLRVWDAASGFCVRVMREPYFSEASIICVCTFGNGCIASGSDNMTVKMWDAGTETDNKVRDSGTLDNVVLKGHTGSVSCICAVGEIDPHVIVSGSFDKTVRVWNADRKVCMHVLEGHSGTVTSVCALSDGRVVSGSCDITLRVWDIFMGVCLQVLSGHANSVSSVCALKSGIIVSGSHNFTLRVWNSASAFTGVKTFSGFELAALDSNVDAASADSHLGRTTSYFAPLGVLPLYLCGKAKRCIFTTLSTGAQRATVFMDSGALHTFDFVGPVR